MIALDAIDRRLLADFQRGFPLTARPYAVLAEALGVDEGVVRTRLARLLDLGVISRVGAVVRPHSAGFSTLAAMAVPPERLESVAALVTAQPEVNHNYQRQHRLNLWFVVAAADEAAVAGVLAGIERASGLPVLGLPLVEDFHIDLGFDLQWT